MRTRIVAIVILAVVLVILMPYAGGVRFTTVSAKQKAEQNQEKVKDLIYENERLRDDVDDLEQRLDNLILDLEHIEPEPNSSGSPNLIRIPGSSRNDNDDDGGSDETRIIERNSTTTIPPVRDRGDGDDGENNNPPIVEVPELPKLPELPELPDVNKTKDDLLKGTPLEDLL